MLQPFRCTPAPAGYGKNYRNSQLIGFVNEFTKRPENKGFETINLTPCAAAAADPSRKHPNDVHGLDMG
jgi:hypothetical protein